MPRFESRFHHIFHWIKGSDGNQSPAAGGLATTPNTRVSMHCLLVIYSLFALISVAIVSIFLMTSLFRFISAKMSSNVNHNEEDNDSQRFVSFLLPIRPTIGTNEENILWKYWINYWKQLEVRTGKSILSSNFNVVHSLRKLIVKYLPIIEYFKHFSIFSPFSQNIPLVMVWIFFQYFRVFR